MIKRTNLSEFKVQRYSKPISCMKCKDDDEVISVTINNDEYIVLTTKLGYALKYKVEEIPTLGLKASGVKAISLKNDSLVGAFITSDQNTLLIVTVKNTAKRNSY